LKMSNQLLPVPTFHPLEQTAVTIENLALDTATSRISKFMKNHSITCSYHSEERFVDCMTDSLLKFVVQLWQGNNNFIIMEVQRRQGRCIEIGKLRFRSFWMGNHPAKGNKSCHQLLVSSSRPCWTRRLWRRCRLEESVCLPL
jgi:hypothetical protein